MQNERTIILDKASRLSVVAVDCARAAAELARAHLSGPTASAYLAQALAGVALLGSETAQAEETVTFRLACPGPLEGFLVECTEKGTLRGYTNRKILNDFDGDTFTDAAVLGATGTVEVIRSIPGKVLSSGSTATAFALEGGGAKKRLAPGYVSRALDAYFAQSLQRRARFLVLGQAGDDGVPACARGLMVACAPDGDTAAYDRVAACFDDGTAAKALGGALLSERTLLRKLGLEHADIRGTRPIAFACRCSAERAAEMIASLAPAARQDLPSTVDVTCHMCGRTWSVPNAR